jgi:lipid A ethanolaminephosphotransferase
MTNTTITKLILITATVITLLGNITFYSNILNTYPVNPENIIFLLSLVFVLGGATVFILSLVCYRYTVKPVLILVLLVSSMAAYFMDTYSIIIDDAMINNILHTDTAEALDLISVRQFFYLLIIGVLPSIYIYRSKISVTPFKTAALSHLKLTGLSLLMVLSIILLLSDFYSSFFREHKELRYYANPGFYLYSAIKYASNTVDTETRTLQTIGMDAVIPESDLDRELIVLVVGETARADHFSLNAYAKKTNPYLEQEDIISFRNFWSCGTSTAVSVPCMFSILGRSDFDDEDARSTENVLDILQRTGVNVLWLDNNSDSKGVADRVPYENYKSPDKNPVCDIECRDEGMLKNLQSYIDSHPQGDILIVLHQMGTHGPAYYKRYPDQFRKFTPTCETNQLEECTEEEINNTYDNAILYTDYFLYKVIKLLKSNGDYFETAMVYMSDHGESLGEKNLYLHGLPYLIAPDVQKKVPVIMWFGQLMLHEVNLDSLRQKIDQEYSHDNLFHTLLGLMEAETSVYNKSLDLIEHEEE